MNSTKPRLEVSLSQEELETNRKISDARKVVFGLFCLVLMIIVSVLLFLNIVFNAPDRLFTVNDVSIEADLGQPIKISLSHSDHESQEISINGITVSKSVRGAPVLRILPIFGPQEEAFGNRLRGEFKQSGLSQSEEISIPVQFNELTKGSYRLKFSNPEIPLYSGDSLEFSFDVSVAMGDRTKKAKVTLITKGELERLPPLFGSLHSSTSAGSWLHNSHKFIKLDDNTLTVGEFISKTFGTHNCSFEYVFLLGLASGDGTEVANRNLIQKRATSLAQATFSFLQSSDGCTGVKVLAVPVGEHNMDTDNEANRRPIVLIANRNPFSEVEENSFQQFLDAIKLTGVNIEEYVAPPSNWCSTISEKNHQEFLISNC